MTTHDDLFKEICEAASQGVRGSHDSGVEQSGQWAIPGYTILEEIHRGGQGVVFRAVQVSTKRVVALKFNLQGSFASERQRYRFEREIEIASHLRHPNIITVYDGGIAENQPYCAMEFVDGKRLDEYWSTLEKEEPSGPVPQIRSRIGHFVKVCEAVGYAHDHGVIHRDLKPANILVDSAGEPKVLDFGLAKAVGEPTDAHSPRTITGEFVGTIAYASPEQAAANGEIASTRSDVYSLGVILYEMLTGTLPVEEGLSLAEKLNRIIAVDPIRPSKLRRELDTDIETILVKSLAKDPQRRYQNANALADDLQRYLHGEPIEARRDSHWYVLRKSVARHKKPVAALLLIFLTLLVSLIAVSLFWQRAINDRNLANESRIEEKKQRDNAEFDSYVAHVAASDASSKIFDPYEGIRNLTQTPEKFRAFEFWYLLDQVDQSEKSLGGFSEEIGQSGHQKSVSSAGYLSNGWIVSGGLDGYVIFRDAKSGVAQLGYHFDSPVLRVRTHPNRIVVAASLHNGTGFCLQLKQRNDGLLEMDSVRQIELGDESRISDLQFSPDGNCLLVASVNKSGQGLVSRFDWTIGKPLGPLESSVESPQCIAISDDGRVSACGGKTIKIWSLETGELLRTITPKSGHLVHSIAFRPDSSELATCQGTKIKVWNHQSGVLLKEFYGHTRTVNSIRFKPDGTMLASVANDRTLRLWDADSGEPLSVKSGHVDSIEELAFRGDGEEIATAGRLCVKLWTTNATTNRQRTQVSHGRIVDLVFHDGSHVAITKDEFGKVVRIDPESDSAIVPLLSSDGILTSCISPTGKLFAQLDDENAITVFGVDDKSARKLGHFERQATSICFSADDNTLFIGTAGQEIYSWKLKSESPTVFATSTHALQNMTVSRDNTLIATRDTDVIAVWNLESGNKLAEWKVTGIALATDQSLAVGETKPARTSESGQVLAQLSEFKFSPDGKRIVARVLHDWGYLGYDQIAVWESTTGRELAQLREHTGPVDSVAWSPDGLRLATGSRDGTVKLWDCERFRLVHTLRGFRGHCTSLAFSADNHLLMGGMEDGSIRTWKTLAPNRR